MTDEAPVVHETECRRCKARFEYEVVTNWPPVPGVPIRQDPFFCKNCEAELEAKRNPPPPDYGWFWNFWEMLMGRR
jgi:hypothetical protein